MSPLRKVRVDNCNCLCTNCGSIYLHYLGNVTITGNNSAVPTQLTDNTANSVK